MPDKESNKFNAIYFEEENSFSEVEQFINKLEKQLNLTLYRFPAHSYHNLQTLVQNNQLKAIVMGTRQDDPNGAKQEIFIPSDIDKGYAPFMRINPILRWTHKQVWSFLRQFELDYCSLYDEGYTYLGNKETCKKNESLKKPDGGYYPAYMCLDEYEKESRIEKNVEKKQQKNQQNEDENEGNKNEL